MVAGGVPGAVGGLWLLYRAHWKGHEETVALALGLLILLAPTLEWRRWRNANGGQDRQTRYGLVARLTFPIGVSVGFSSAGAVSLGTLALLRFTALPPVQVVGTDILFGLALPASGGLAHVLSDGLDAVFLAKLLDRGLAGGMVGARLAGKLPAAALRHWLVITLAALSVVLVVRSAGAARRGLRRRAAGGGEVPRQGARALHPRQVRPVGPSRPAPRAVKSLQLAHQSGRERSRVSAVELGRTGRVELHPAGAHPRRSAVFRAAARGGEPRWNARARLP